jgi:hypothetical protein
VPSELVGKRRYLQFAGVNQVADVWVNGTYLGQHKGGYSRFRFGVTGVLVSGGVNVIAVRVTNARDTDIAPVSADLKVYSNADTVTATLNGTSLGVVSSSDRVFRWPNVTLKPGRNTIVVTAAINGSTYTDTADWTLG